MAPTINLDWYLGGRLGSDWQSKKADERHGEMKRVLHMVSIDFGKVYNVLWYGF